MTRIACHLDMTNLNLQILRRVFGLQAYFATSRVEEGKSPNWPSHKNHKWHAKDELETR